MILPPSNSQQTTQLIQKQTHSTKQPDTWARRAQVSHERRSHALAVPAQALHQVSRSAPAGSGAGGEAAVLGLAAEVPRDVSEASDAHVALLTALPFGLAAAWMLLLAKHSQATGTCCTQHMSIRGIKITQGLCALERRKGRAG